FTVNATATLKGQKVGEDRQLLVCESADREMADLRAKPDLMENLSRISGGESFSLNSKSGSEISAIFGTPPPADIEYRRTPLWDKWWGLSLLVLLLTLEWSVRRLAGMA